MTRVRALVRRGEELLVEETVDPERGERTFRPVGARVEDGEAAAEAAGRALRNCLGVAVAGATDLGTFSGERVFEVEPTERWPYAESGFTLYDTDTGESTRLAWLHLDDFRKYGETLVPVGLLAALDE